MMGNKQTETELTETDSKIFLSEHLKENIFLRAMKDPEVGLIEP